jgi:glycosyltransferase involved in cell wall biosynthesis
MKKRLVYIASNVDYPITFEWIAKSKIAASFDLEFIFLNPVSPTIESKLKELGIKSKTFSYHHRTELPKVTLQIYNEFKSHRPNIVHTHLLDATLAGLTAARLVGVKKRIHTRHHSNPYHLKHRQGLIYDAVSNLLSTTIIATCQNVKNVLTKLEYVPEKKIKVIPFGFDLDSFETVSAERIKAVREKNKIPEKSPVIGLCSRYIEIKGLQYVIPAFTSQKKK